MDSISQSVAKKILKAAGAERVGDAAAEELANMLNRYAYSVASKAVKLARHANRKTVEKSDVELAKQ